MHHKENKMLSLKKTKTIEGIIEPIARIVAELDEFATQQADLVEKTNLAITDLTKKADHHAVQAANASALSSRYSTLLTPASNVEKFAAE
jgi:methyl-accepting chemotaxis protein